MASKSNAPRRHRSAARVITASTAAILAVAVGIASAAPSRTGLELVGTGTPGGSSSTPASASQTGGGALAPTKPVIADVICATGCVGLRKPTPGGTVQISGENLAAVNRISFAGRKGRIFGTVVSSTKTSVVGKVPPDAAAGRVRVKDGFGNRSELSAVELDIHPRSEIGSAGALEIAEAIVTPETAFFDGARQPRLTFVIRSNQRSNDLRIDLTNAEHLIVRSWFRNGVETNTTNSVRWDGRTSAGDVAPNGDYAFRVSAPSGQRVARTTSVPRDAFGFTLYGRAFPIRGPHDYGGAIARFGVSRPGHTHQGQDVFADCGTPMVAVRGGRATFSGYESSAGHYIVIDGIGTGEDNVYMHLLKPPLLKAGDTVRTGQLIGQVGETGNASGCHLHFERWSAGGWYESGAPFDPLPGLKQWDRYS